MEGLFQRAITGVIDFFLTPVQTIFNFLTSPQTFMALTDRLADAIHTAEATLYSYQIPFLFTTLGIYLYLAGLAYAVLAYLRGNPWTVFRPVILGGILLPLFAYRGPECTTEGYPCVPKVRYELERVPSQNFKTYKEARFRFDNGRLIMEEVSRETGIDITKDYHVFRLKTDDPVPPGTAIALSLVETSSLIGRNTFYASLARYQENMSELRDVYQKLTRTAFSLMTGAAFTQRLGGILVESVVGSLIPIPGAGKVGGNVTKSLAEKVAKFLKEKAPPFLRFALGTGVASTIQGAQQVAARTAQVNLNIAQVLASLPLLLVLSFVGIFYIAILGAKLAVFAVPLGIAFMAFAPQAANRYLNYLVVLLVFPAVLGSFFSLATKVLFVNGIERQIQEFQDRSTKMLESYYIQNPTAAMVAAQVTNTVANQVKNLQACLKAPLPKEWEAGKRGRELSDGGPIGTIACYPSYGIEAYLSDAYQIPQDPAQIRTEAIAIARHFSLDLANLLSPNGNYLNGQLRLPKGVVGGNFIGNSSFADHGLYGKLTYSEIVPQGSPDEAKAFLLHNPNSTAPIEVGRIARKALEVATRPSENGLRDLIEEIRFFIRKVDELAAKVETLTEGASVREFLEEGIRWEIAWNYSPEFLLEGLGAEVQTRIGLGAEAMNGLRKSLQELPPLIRTEALGTYSRLYAMGKGTWSPENPTLPMLLPGGGNGTPTPFFAPSQFLKTPPTYNLAPKVCAPDDKAEVCRLAYTVAPYLPYAYMDHYEVLNQLGAEAIGALANLRSRQIMGLIYIALTIAMALYVFRALVQTFGTLFEGMAPLGRGMVGQVSRALSAVTEIRPFAPVAFPSPVSPTKETNTAPSFGPLENLLKEEQKRNLGLKESLHRLEKHFSELTEEEKKQFREELERIHKANPLAHGLSKEGFTVFSLTLRNSSQSPEGEMVVLELPIRREWEEEILLDKERRELEEWLTKERGEKKVFLDGEGKPYSFPVGLLEGLTEEARKKLNAFLEKQGWLLEIAWRGETALGTVLNQDGRVVAVLTERETPSLRKALEEIKAGEEAHPLKALREAMERAWEAYLKRVEKLLQEWGYQSQEISPGLYRVAKEGSQPSFLLIEEGTIAPRDFYVRFGDKKPSQEEVHAFVSEHALGSIPSVLTYGLTARLEALNRVKPRDPHPIVEEMPLGYTLSKFSGEYPGAEAAEKTKEQKKKEKEEQAAQKFAQELERSPHIFRKFVREVFYGVNLSRDSQEDYPKILTKVSDEAQKTLYSIGMEELSRLKKKIPREEETALLRSMVQSRISLLEELLETLKPSRDEEEPDRKDPEMSKRKKEKGGETSHEKE